MIVLISSWPSFFFVAHGIPYEDSNIEYPGGWADEKKRLVESGENPAGFVPVVYDGEHIMTEHHSIIRYYAKLAGVYGKEYGLPLPPP